MAEATQDQPQFVDGWISDSRGNKCSTEYFGSEDAARTALESLKNCDFCTNCSRCSDCSRCSGCSGCSDCSRCSGCSRCSRCSGCSDCSHVAYLVNKRDHIGDPLAIKELGEPSIPIIPDIDKAVYAAVTAKPDSLNMGAWHTCETTHCRAGWVVTLAGEQGKKLERFHNTELAAMLIYKASGSPINPARFYDGNAAALEDMRKRAGAEA